MSGESQVCDSYGEADPLPGDRRQVVSRLGDSYGRRCWPPSTLKQTPPRSALCASSVSAPCRSLRQPTLSLGQSRKERHMAISMTPDSRIEYDKSNRAIRSWFDMTGEPVEVAPFDAMEMARRVLSESANLFRWSQDLPDLVDHRLIEAEQFSARFAQEFKGLPVDDSEVVVDLTLDGSSTRSTTTITTIFRRRLIPRTKNHAPPRRRSCAAVVPRFRNRRSR